MVRLLMLAGVLTAAPACFASMSPTENSDAAQTAAGRAEEPAFSVDGYSLGQPAAEAEARVPPGTVWKEVDGARQAELTISWKARPATLTVRVRDGSVYGLELATSREDAPIEDVLAWAKAVCGDVTPAGQPFVGWAAPPSRRYRVPFKEAVKRGATLACLVDEPGNFTLVGAAHDLIFADVSRGLSTARRERYSSMLSALVPFDWRTRPHVGDPIDLGGFRYTIERIVPLDEVGTNRLARQKATVGAKFVVVVYMIENIGNETSAVLANDLLMRDAKGRTFRPSSAATNSVAAEVGVDLLLAELQPGIPRKQLSVFEVPQAELTRLDLVIPEKGMLGSGEAVLPLTFFEPEFPE